jgi:MFS transporter, SP family, solute carrier family 2 (facilitated glucose transporter), member 3
MNPPVKVVFPGHSTLSWAVAVAAFAAGGPFGARCGGNMADSQGRRGALILDMWLFVIGGMLQTLAPNMVVIIIARFIVGFASGYSSVVVPIYVGEMSPPQLRGSLGTITQFALTIGIFASDVLAFPFCQEPDEPDDASFSKWRIFFGFTPVVSLIQLVVSSQLLLESPRWQLMHNVDDSAVGESISRLSGGGISQDELQNEMERLLSTSSLRELGIELDSGSKTDAAAVAAVRNEQPEESNTSASSSSSTHAAIFGEMWAHGSIRILLISAVLLNMTQQLSGINAVFYYSTQFFQGV